MNKFETAGSVIGVLIITGKSKSTIITNNNNKINNALIKYIIISIINYI